MGSMGVPISPGTPMSVATGVRPSAERSCTAPHWQLQHPRTLTRTAVLCLRSEAGSVKSSAPASYTDCVLLALGTRSRQAPAPPSLAVQQVRRQAHP